jgi:hypothetical protein
LALLDASSTLLDSRLNYKKWEEKHWPMKNVGTHPASSTKQAVYGIPSRAHRNRIKREREMMQRKRIFVSIIGGETENRLCLIQHRALLFIFPRPPTTPSWTEFQSARFHSRAGSRAAV